MLTFNPQLHTRRRVCMYRTACKWRACLVVGAKVLMWCRNLRHAPHLSPYQIMSAG